MSEKKTKEARKYKLSEVAMKQIGELLQQRQNVEATIQTYVKGLMDAQGLDPKEWGLNLQSGMFEEKPKDA